MRKGLAWLLVGVSAAAALVFALWTENERPRPASYGQLTSGGMDDRMLSMLPPVFRPNIVPRS